MLSALTSSFQNQTTTSCLLAGAAAKEIATSSVSGDSVCDQTATSSKRKRGVHAFLKKCKLKAGQQKEAPEFQTLQQIIIHDEQTFDNGFQCVDNFIERNASMKMHKAIATQVFSTAIMFKYSHSS